MSVKLEFSTLNLEYIMAIAPEELLVWLRQQLDSRGWSQNELAEKSGISSGLMSGIMNGRRPGMKVCKGLARALEVDEEVVLKLAGHIKKKPGFSALRDEWASLADNEEESVIHRWIAMLRADKESRQRAGEKRGRKE